MLNIADGLLDAATYAVKVGAGGAGAILNAGVLAGNNGIGSQVGPFFAAGGGGGGGQTP